MRQTRKVLAMILAVLLVLGAGSSALAVSNADILSAIGVFRGTDSGYELDRVPTRIEGLVMLIRLMGDEEAALDCQSECPFTDVPEWAECYAAYAYENGLTQGQSATCFGTSDELSDNDYCTFLLRCLGYSDADGDFTWQDSVEKCESIGVCPDSSSDELTRSDMVDFTCGALKSSCRGSGATLCSLLIQKGALSRQAAIALGCYGSWGQLPSGGNGNGGTVEEPDEEPAEEPDEEPVEEPDEEPAEEPDEEPAGTTESEYAAEVLRLVNEYRAQYGLAALTADGTLSDAAMYRAEEINRSYGHTRPDGRAFYTVLGDFGIKYSTAGENIAIGQRTPEEVMNDWMNSSGHRANILNANYKKLGVGVVKSTTKGYNGYCWSQEFIG